jgi:NAD(P)-dependent dehydrogenase (short-subunit alcohol dehydrogenase family)
MGALRTTRRIGKLATGVSLAFGARATLRRRRALDLDGRVVLITGGSRGLGLALAEAFAHQGARLAICGRDAQRLEEAYARLTAQGAETLAVPCDVSDPEQVKRLISTVEETYGRIDVLVNNAGTISVGPLATQTPADFETAMGSMFWGPLHATLAVLPGMRARGVGRIVNITSIGGKVSVPHLAPYAAAKFAAVGFSEGLRAELAGSGVHVITVVPGLMRTGSHINALFKGNQPAEYTWFALGDTLPFTSMDAAAAARRIVRATIDGDAELTLTPQAQLLARVHGLAPGLTADVLGLVNRALPKAPSMDDMDQAAYGDDVSASARQPRLGRDSETALTRSFLTTLGRQAAAAYNQHPDIPPDGEDVLLSGGNAPALGLG